MFYNLFENPPKFFPIFRNNITFNCTNILKQWLRVGGGSKF